MTDTKITTNEKDVALLKVVFKDNEYLLKAMRSLWFGLEVADHDKEVIKTTFAGAEIREAVRKKMYPLLSDDTSIAIAGDYWLAAEKDVQGQSYDTISQVVQSKQKVLEMMQYAITVLENPYLGKINLEYNPNIIVQANDPMQTWLVARCLYIRTINNTLGQIYMVAQAVEATPEEIKNKQKRDSLK